MTQPPNQPPQGGFGAPQDQPPQGGGFGAPQTPPAQGGFGPPSTPPAPPAAPQGTPPPPAQPPAAPAQPPAGPQPGYGYPQQPGPYGAPAAPGAQNPYNAPTPPGTPGPYGYPQQPQQPGFGYPQQPPYPGAPAPAPGAGGGRRKTALIVGAAVAALAVIGGTVYAVTSGGDGKKKPVAQQSDGPKNASGSPSPSSSSGGLDPENLNAGRKPGEAKVLWYQSAPQAPGAGAEAPGMWITDKVAVKAAYKQVFAYGVGDGKPAWSPIGFPQKICAVTPQKSADDKVVVAYMSGISDNAQCNQLQQIDLNTGQKGWSGTLDRHGAFDIQVEINLAVSGKTLMVSRSGAGTAYDIDSGKKLYNTGQDSASCGPSGYAGGAGRLIEADSCAAFQPNEHDEIRELDPATGKVKWTQPVKKGWEVKKVYSVDPLVVYLTNQDKKAWNISTFTKDGKFRSEVKVDGKFAPRCGFLSQSLEGCQGVAADADTLYLPTDTTGSANEIVAISLATGKEKWRVKSPAAEPMSPMKIEGGKLIAYVQPSYDTGGQVVSIPLGGGAHTTTKLLQNPSGTAQIEDTFFSSDIDWADGRFFISTVQLTGNNQTKEKLMMAFGN